MTCLDTTFLIELLRGSERARRKYEELLQISSERNEQEAQLCTTIINAYELAKGAMLTKDPARNLQLVHDLLSELLILELDLPSVNLASELYSSLSSKGNLIGEFDILIASICISHGQKLLTNDGDFASVSRLAKLRY